MLVCSLRGSFHFLCIDNLRCCVVIVVRVVVNASFLYFMFGFGVVAVSSFACYVSCPWSCSVTFHGVDTCMCRGLCRVGLRV